MVRPEHENANEKANSEAEAKALKTLVGFAQKDIKEGRTISSGQLKDRLTARKRTTEQ
ncbi:prevent-host-death protein [Vibrio parahaemolyticus]|nr:prevent-host-death protein [Vibrio parahaemolyticus]TBT51211.1 prevent-host-death protein [Vibrio parahaemolyticus]